MKRYDSYKDSGVEWIGKIPSHWETLPLKRYGKFGKGLSFTKADLVDEGYPVISYGQIHSKHNSCTGNNDELIRFVPGVFIDHADNSIVSMGDFIFADTSEDLEGSGNAVYIDRDSDIYGGYHTIVFQTENKDNKYLAYLFKTDYWRSQIRSRVSGVKVYSITQSILNLVSIILPPYEEQNAISTYLDKKCGEIDKAIATQEKRVELLKELRQNIITQAVTHGINPNAPLKDSGVEWIGEVPEHWEVMKTSLIYSNIGSGTTPSTANLSYYTESGDGYYWLQTGDLNDGEILDTSKKVTNLAIRECNLKFYPINSVVIAMYGATIGKVGLLKVETSTNQACCVLPESKKVIPAFSFYLYQSAKTPMLLEAMGGGQPNISQDIIKKLKVPVPPLSEQQEIVSYIESQTARLDKSIIKAEHQIELLQELKQSIITEVVTGKRKVD